MNSDLKKEIMELVASDLSEVEIALYENLNPNTKLIQEIASHIMFGVGKRLRPLFMIHGARMCGYSKGDEAVLSVIFEYLHVASLLHDDVLDGADIRRGKQSAHRRWSVSKAVLTGDFLLARALNIAAKTGSSELISVISDITQAMSQGEIDQLDKKGKIDLTEDEYFQIIERKTAALIQGACQSGAILSGADKKTEESLKLFGFHIGMAFQMIDDLLDYMASPQDWGKNLGADMREGKMTLPLIISLANAGSEDRQIIEDLLLAPDFDYDKFAILKPKVFELNGFEYTKSLAFDHIYKAKDHLEIFKNSDSKKLLLLIADYVMDRNV